MAPAGWKIIGSTKAPPVERPPEPYAWFLEGDQFGLIVPLRWPLAHDLEDNLSALGERQVMAIWQVFVARSESDPPGAPDVVAFPAEDDELATYLPMPDGSPLDERYMTWKPRPGRVPADRPTQWSELIAWWYRQQIDFSKKQLAVAFGEALEALTGLPLERVARSLHTFITSEDSGAADFGSKVVSISKTNGTGPKSGRSRTTSSSKTRPKTNGQTSTGESAQ